MIPPAHLCPQLGTLCFSFPPPKPATTSVGGYRQALPQISAATAVAQCQVFSILGYVPCQAEGLLIPGLIWSNLGPLVPTAT